MQRLLIAWHLIIASAMLCASPTYAQVDFSKARAFSEAVVFENRIDAGDSEHKFYESCGKDIVGPPFAHITVKETQPWQFVTFPGEGVLLIDPCGYRTENLSGVWQHTFSDQQYVVSHDPRTGAFSARLMYVPSDDEERAKWGRGLGHVIISGRLHERDIWLQQHLNFPLEAKSRCPDQYDFIGPAVSVKLNYTADSVQLHFYAPFSNLNYGTCTVTVSQMQGTFLKRLELEQ